MAASFQRIISGLSKKSVFSEIQRLGVYTTQIRNESIKAAVLKEYGSPLEISEIKLKKLKKNELRIKVRYCSVNPSDFQILLGQHEFQPILPYVPGYEVAGVVLEVGSEASQKGFKVGDKVVGLNKVACGGFAEQCTLVLQDCFPAPTGVSSKVASALLEGHSTALLGLVRRGRVKEDDTVLVTAAGGGVGLAAVDLASNVYRAKVIAVCSTEDKAALVREKGAFAALKYNKNVGKEIMHITKGEGAGLVFDATGGEVLENVMKCVRTEGRLVLASNAARNTESLSPSSLLPRSISLVGISLWHYRHNVPDIYKKTIEEVIDMAEQELIIPHISKEFDLKDVNEALQYLQDDKCTGKVVLAIDD